MSYTRLSAGPRMLVYDNACNVHRHCIKWQPAFFKHTMFRIDRIHKFNHHSCGSGYFLDNDISEDVLVPGVTVSSLNSQMAEQRNSVLERIRTTITYMSHENAFAYMKYFLAQTNMPIIERLLIKSG